MSGQSHVGLFLDEMIFKKENYKKDRMIKCFNLSEQDSYEVQAQK